MKRMTYMLAMYCNNTDAYRWSNPSIEDDDKEWLSVRFGRTNVDSKGTHWLPVQHRMPEGVDVMYAHGRDTTFFWVRQNAAADNTGDSIEELTDSELTRLLQRIHTNWKNSCQTKT